MITRTQAPFDIAVGTDLQYYELQIKPQNGLAIGAVRPTRPRISPSDNALL